MGSPRFEKLLQNVRKFPDMGEKTKIYSSHLYQLYAYLRNAERKHGWEQSDGMLLYPAVSHSFDHRFRIEDRQIRVTCIDLAQNWQSVESGLLKFLVGEDGAHAL